MTDDPYKILGLDRDASDEEIKRTYRQLVKKYHPDLNPGDEEAAKKMRQINAAYEQIKDPSKARPSASSYEESRGGYEYEYEYDPFGFGGWQRTYRRQETSGDPYQRAAFNYIQFGRYREALNILSNSQNRDARWYYLSALANDGLGNQVTALEHIRRAVSMEPDNQEYLSALEQIENGGAFYRRQAGDYRGFGYGGSRLSSLCLCYFLSLFCCRGRFFFCC